MKSNSLEEPISLKYEILWEGGVRSFFGMKETANQICYEVIYAADSAAILTKSITFFIYEPGGVIYFIYFCLGHCDN